MLSESMKALSDIAIEHIKSDLERLSQPLLLEKLLDKSKDIPEGKQIIIEHRYGRSRQ